VAGFAQFAGGAELDLRYHPKAERPFSWSTCYGGIHLGVGATEDTFTSNFNDIEFQVAGVQARGQNYWGFGVLGGVQVGCNYQLGRFVVGLESEFWGSSLKAENNYADFDFAAKTSAANPWTFASSARAGLTFDDFWVYLKGGIAWGSFSYSYTDNLNLLSAASGSAISTGALVGLGIEYAFAPLWTAKVETNAILFSAFNAQLSATPGFLDTFGGPRVTISATQILFKLGVNRMFNFE
jgi:hypothetical protein